MTGTETRRAASSWAVWVIAGAFALLFAYAVWSAVNYLVAWVQAAGAAGQSLSAMGWAAWILAIVLPILLFGVALGLGRRRGKLTLTLFLLTALSLVAVFWLNVMAYTTIVPIIA
ncbi:hypothetical protein [Microbacterium sp. JZ31]|uniref:hypothetical protein n=1 Tax=Microbacterium sp. JZ31 TaxID=1906274 RepID=UPI001933A312|nr:hypothetical protein [Microbacterium sp. JZ31]